MRNEDEIQQAQDLSDMEILKSFIPSWDNTTRIEPFLSSPQDGLQQPTWNKIQFDPLAYGDLGSSPGGGTIRGIMVVDGVARYVDFPGSIGEPV